MTASSIVQGASLHNFFSIPSASRQPETSHACTVERFGRRENAYFPLRRRYGLGVSSSSARLPRSLPALSGEGEAEEKPAHKQQNGCASGRMPCPLLIQLGLMCGTRWAPPALQLQCGSTDTLVAPDLDWLPQWTRTAHLLSTGGTVHASGHRIQLETSPIIIISGSLLIF